MSEKSPACIYCGAPDATDLTPEEQRATSKRWYRCEHCHRTFGALFADVSLKQVEKPEGGK